MSVEYHATIKPTRFGWKAVVTRHLTADEPGWALEQPYQTAWRFTRAGAVDAASGMGRSMRAKDRRRADREAGATTWRVGHNGHLEALGRESKR